MMVAYRIREKAHQWDLRTESKGAPGLQKVDVSRATPLGHTCAICFQSCLCYWPTYTFSGRRICSAQLGSRLALGEGRTGHLDSRKVDLTRKAGLSGCYCQHPFWLVRRGETHVILVVTYLDCHPWRGIGPQRKLSCFSWEKEWMISRRNQQMFSAHISVVK